MPKYKVIVCGAGPAGMMAAIRSAQLGAEVTLLEKNPIPGNKILLSGKGRCNLTNSCELNDFLERFSDTGLFLRDAFKKFFNLQLMEFFEKRGLALRVERQCRVFPVTDRADSVVEVLKKEIKKLKVNVLFNKHMSSVIVKDGAVKAVVCDGNIFQCERLIMATGGVSFGFTGSTGEGLKIAKSLGHTLMPLGGGLVPMIAAQPYVSKLEGITLRNIRITFSSAKTRLVTAVGELVFTARGISGPLVLTYSGKIGEWLLRKKAVTATIDLKPALDEAQLNARLLREFSANARKNIKNTIKNLMPGRLSEVCLELARIDLQTKCGQLTQEQRRSIVSFLKSMRLDITSLEPIERAMVTRGGVSLKEIDPRTMASRLVKGLYFAGEMIDVDADTGGFNLQAAFSTGYLAGESAALS